MEPRMSIHRLILTLIVTGALLGTEVGTAQALSGVAASGNASAAQYSGVASCPPGEVLVGSTCATSGVAGSQTPNPATTAPSTTTPSTTTPSTATTPTSGVSPSSTTTTTSTSPTEFVAATTPQTSVTTATGQLPFTGYAAITVVLLGLALLAVGLVVRWRLPKQLP